MAENNLWYPLPDIELQIPRRFRYSARNVEQRFAHYLCAHEVRVLRPEHLHDALVDVYELRRKVSQRHVALYVAAILYLVADAYRPDHLPAHDDGVIAGFSALRKRLL